MLFRSQAEDGIRYLGVTGVQTCALPIYAIADVWVDAALRLTDRDLRMMAFLLRAQMRRMQYGDVSDITAELREPAQAAL